MLNLASLPLSEKVYLADKTLINATDLQVGDKILSLKITKDGINDISDILTKIIDADETVSNYEICEATVYSAQKYQQEDLLTLNNGVKIKKNQYIVVKDLSNNNLEFSINNIEAIQNKHHNMLTSEINTCSINKDFSEDLSNLFKINKIDSITNNVGLNWAYSIKIVGGHFYFTENFIVLAEVGR